MLTVKDIAELLSVKPGTVYDWVENNEIPFVRIGRTIRFDREQIDIWIASKTHFPPNPTQSR